MSHPILPFMLRENNPPRCGSFTIEYKNRLCVGMGGFAKVR